MERFRKETASAAVGAAAQATEDARCCGHCMHSRPVHGSDQFRLMCENRSGYRGFWYLVGADDVCARFRQAVNVPVLPDGTRAIPLTQGKFALVDEADYADLIRHSWSANRNRSGYNGHHDTFYAVRSKPGQTIRMHRQVMDAGPDQVVDHINHNGLDNRRCNLRLCSIAENARNTQGWRKRSSSRYKGVSYRRRSNKWRAAITYKRKQLSLGQFDSETDAARAYNEKARELFGEFAYLNDV